jgi:UTP--glucose-1-phosphate uridylyltransferase
MKVDVAVIPAAGRGTRMRPATRSVHKSFLPLVDRPAIQWIVEEGLRAGVSEFVVIVDPGQADLVVGHFEGLDGFADPVIHPVIQPWPAGLGDAVRHSREIVDGRPFFCMLADNLVWPDGDVLPRMAEASDGRSVVCLRDLDDEGLERYGVVVAGDRISERVVEVLGAVEKPGVDAAPSRLGLVGRYLFDAALFDHLEALEPGHGGEIQLTDAIAALGEGGACLGWVGERDLLDIGNPTGYLEAGVALGLAHPEIGPGFRAFLRALLEAG